MLLLLMVMLLLQQKERSDFPKMTKHRQSGLIGAPSWATGGQQWRTFTCMAIALMDQVREPAATAGYGAKWHDRRRKEAT